MSAATAPAPPLVSSSSGYRVTGWRVLRSEWAKFWSLRSTWITLAISVLLLVAVGLVAAARYTSSTAAGSGPHRLVSVGSDAVSVALAGITLAQLAVGVLGVLFSGSEYTTGSIRSTLVAVPRRLPVLWSKATVFAVVIFVLGAVGAFASFLGGEHSLSGQKIALTLTSPGVLRALFAAGLYLALVGVISVALGALIRSVAGGIAIMIVILMLLPVLTDLLPSSWSADVTPYLPGNAGDAAFALTHSGSTLSPGVGLAVFAGWAALALALAAVRLIRTDA
jgi:ABC-2 type transport system permease protein